MGENIFGSYANERKNEQDRIEKSVAPRKHDKRAQFTIAMSAANKKKLKMYAIKRGKPVSKIVEEWIEKYAN